MVCGAIGKCILILLNTLLAIIGFIILAAGATILALKDFANDTLNGVLESIPTLPDAAGIDGASAAPAGGLTTDLSPFLNPAGWALVVIGGFLFAVCIFGCCGASRENKICLTVYVAIFLVILLVEIILVAIYFSDTFDDSITKQMQSTIEKDYGGIDDFNIWSIFWNVIQLQLKCCGVTGYTDFNKAANWKKERTITVDVGGVSYKQNVVFITPVTCCKMKGDFPSVEPIDNSCMYNPTDLNNNWKTGCWQKMSDELEQFNNYIIIGVVVLFVFELLLIIFALVICCGSSSPV